ncbi:DUF2157 domain-containing protein [Rhodoligotrophos defluvii]|uniref:DUF2157 domain-containing protein n=1 Tax=Rhodoligotrophos defluvii TaxID=2561934 RepID=UPI0014851BD6|nr:DUF2157 domain-containing protein [Rhodoligotrophos defluvii]
MVFERYYRNRLAADLPVWRERGWVTPDGASAILATLPEPGRHLTLSTIVATLGGLLLGAAAIAFVAANWEGMAPFARFLLLLATLAAAYAAAAVLKQRNHPALSDAMVLVAGLVFAAAIALVGQAYNLTGEFRDAILLWTLGCFGAALLTRSLSATVLSLVGVSVWAFLAITELGRVVHWASLVLLLAIGAHALWLDGSFARRAFVAASTFWIAFTLIQMTEALGWPYIGGLSLCAAVALFFWSVGAFLASGTREGGFADRLVPFGRELTWPALVGLLIALFVMQGLFEETRADALGWFLPAVIIALLAATIAMGAAWRGAVPMVHAVLGMLIVFCAIVFAYWQTVSGDGEHAAALWPRLAIAAVILVASLWLVALAQTDAGYHVHTLGLAAFGIEILYLYIETLGTLIDTALAFLVGGILLIALSIGLVRLDRWLRSQRRSASP